MPPMVDFSEEFRLLCIWFFKPLSRPPENNNSYVPVMFPYSLYFSYQIVNYITRRRDPEIHLGYETLFRGFRLGFVVWSLLRFSNAGSHFRRFRCVPCLRRNWAEKLINRSVSLCHTSWFSGAATKFRLHMVSSELEYATVPRIVWVDRDLSYLAVPLGLHAARVQTQYNHLKICSWLSLNRKQSVH